MAKNTTLFLSLITPKEVAKILSERVRMRRLELDLTQEGMAARAGLKFSTYRRFEQTGEISLLGLLYIAFALDALNDFEKVFTQRQYRTLEDVINETKVTRKRGKKKE